MDLTSGHKWPLVAFSPISRPRWKLTNRSKSMIFGQKSSKMAIFYNAQVRNCWTDFHELSFYAELVTWTVLSTISQIWATNRSRVTVDLLILTPPRRKMGSNDSRNHYQAYFGLENDHFYRFHGYWKHTWPQDLTSERHLAVFRWSSELRIFSLFWNFSQIFFLF